MRFSRIFRAIVVSASAPAAGVAWVGCSNGPAASDDGGEDATVADVKDSSSPFGDVTLDAYVDWCEAGAPSLYLTEYPCYNWFYVPCGVPPQDFVYASDAGLKLNRCDQICKGVGALKCTIAADPLAGLDAGGDAGDAGVSFASPDAEPDGAVFILCDGCSGGRKPVGLRRPRRSRTSPLADLFGEMATLEAASVPAFARMHAELSRMGASQRLLRRVRGAARDERRHAKTMDRVARRFGGTPAPVRVRGVRARSAFAVARENAVEGCVRETYGALVAAWQAAHAGDAEVRQTMHVIAEDEARHAELSWAVARFLDRRLSTAERRRVASATRRAIAALHEGTRRRTPQELIDAAGLPDAATARKLLDGLSAALWSRE